MRLIKCFMVLSLCIILAPGYSYAQFGAVVFDPSNWAENATQVLNTLEMIKNQLTDLQTYVVFPIVSIAQDLSRLHSVINELKSLMLFDKERTDALFSTMFGSAPCTESALTAWEGEVRSVMHNAHHAAVYAQTLINDILELIDCITSIIDQIVQMVGSVQGLQALGQIQSVVVHQQARMMAMMGAFQSAMSIDVMYRITGQHAKSCIAQARLRDIPRENPYGVQIGSR
jgi:conjugal transfer/entry exclusion protein